MQTPRRLPAIVAVALIVAGCAANAPSTSPTAPASATATAGASSGAFGIPGPSPTPSPSTTPNATGYVEPTDEPVPTETPVVCPTTLPTALSSVADLAHPSCYGTADLTVDGWLEEGSFFVDEGQLEPTWTIARTYLFRAPPTSGEFVLSYLLDNRGAGPATAVVTPPTSGVELGGRGRWVRLHGHFNDPAASACRSDNPDLGSQELRCSWLFVVSGLEPLSRPAPSCPTTAPISVATFLRTDARCFLGKDVQIAGWEDQSEGVGGQTSLYPFTYPGFQLLASQLVSAPIGDPNTTALDPWIFPMKITGSAVTFAKLDTKVIVTGHFGDPAAAKCTPGPYADWTWSPPVEWAQHRCEHFFVITSVAPRS